MASQYPNKNRWYDRDPVLSRAMAQLREAPNRYQAQIALNIIKIIVEHQIEDHTQMNADKINDVLESKRFGESQPTQRRWYDMHETLGSAIQLLNDCPDDLQARIIPSIATMIEETLDENMCD